MGYQKKILGFFLDGIFTFNQVAMTFGLPHFTTLSIYPPHSACVCVSISIPSSIPSLTVSWRSCPIFGLGSRFDVLALEAPHMWRRSELDPQTQRAGPRQTTRGPCAGRNHEVCALEPAVLHLTAAGRRAGHIPPQCGGRSAHSRTELRTEQK